MGLCDMFLDIIKQSSPSAWLALDVAMSTGLWGHS